jgi:hypothetical protein
MTGMWNFKSSLFFGCLASLVGAAEVSFSGDNKITGEPTSMDADGVIILTTPHSDQPIKLQASKVSKIDFGKPDQMIETPQQNLTLANGDSFPVGIRGLDDKTLQITTPHLGDLDIPREIVASLDIGIFAKKSIYSGPKQISEWKNSVDEVSKWQMENGSLVASGPGLVYRDVKLPENYSVRFKASWENNPNFRFYFGDPMNYSEKAVNRYYIQYGNAGMEIKRESTGKTRYSTVAVIPLKPQEFSPKELWIEIRVTRKNGRLDLYLNDKLEGRYADPFPDLPNGTGISFGAQASDENKLRISDVDVSDWEDHGDRHRGEDRGDGKEDAVIGRNGERFGGNLLSITNGPNDAIYRFKSNFQAEPIELPESEVSSIQFKNTTVVDIKNFDGLSLFLQGRGNMRVSKCIFNESTIDVTHPLLGDLKINRAAISRLERSTHTKSNPSKEK